ncbi:MAG: nickel pincer cofactor biosynthesis protein LarB [bacterium]
MYKEKIKEILLTLKNHQISVEEALKKLENLPYEDLGFANIDHHRALRKGFPEVVYCQNKRPEQVLEIIKKIAEHNDVLATRASGEIYDSVKEVVRNAEYNEISKSIIVKHRNIASRNLNSNKILVISAGTSDIPVAEEAVVTAEVMGNAVERLYDVGVAGIHRLFNNKEKIEEANVLIIVAGMDGVLPSVVSGLVEKPVIAVPTSVGYGASFQGVGPLLTMLNACAPGITVVNIDNGFGAGYFASLINN